MTEGTGFPLEEALTRVLRGYAKLKDLAFEAIASRSEVLEVRCRNCHAEIGTPCEDEDGVLHFGCFLRQLDRLFGVPHEVELDDLRAQILSHRAQIEQWYGFETGGPL